MDIYIIIISIYLKHIGVLFMVYKYGNLILVKSYKSWNIVVRLILGSPYNAQTYLLCPIMGQTGIREHLYIRNFRFL